jgi:leucine-rich repeat protein SHOC2
VPYEVKSYAGAGLAGALPASIGDLGPELDELTLDTNAITGAVPDEIGLLTGLTTLSLSVNQITSIPTTIGDLANLVNLYLSHNAIQTVPAEIGQLTSLKRLRLSYNDLTGVPVTFRTLDPTIDCDLEGNLHSGFTCANVGVSSSCCTTVNCDSDTSTCYAPP